MDGGENGNVRTGEPIGRVGNGRYVLQSPLGEGGMASVHRAHDTLLNRTVAVKTLHADLARDPSFRERFRREAQGVAALNHPNVVAVHDPQNGRVAPMTRMPSRRRARLPSP